MRQKGLTLIELMVVVAILGILVSLAVPAYQNYIIRARIAEGLHLAQAAKIAVAETTMINHSLPLSQEETNYSSPTATENVQSIAIGSKGIITITYTERAGNGTLVLAPSLQASGELTWSCHAGGLKRQYRPGSCRS